MHRGHHPGHPAGQTRPQPGNSPDGEASRPLLAAPGLLRHCCHCCRPTHGRETSDHVGHPVHHARPDGEGLLFSFSTVWWTLPITALALVGYFLLPDIFYLWMAILGGGGMIALGVYIRSRW